MRVGARVIIIGAECIHNTRRGIIIEVHREGYKIQFNNGAVDYVENEYVYPDVY